MKPRDAVGMAMIAGGMALCWIAWQLAEFWWGVLAALLLTGGFALLWTRERDERIKEPAADIHDEGLGWRLRWRRGALDHDGDGMDVGDGGD